MSDHPYRSLPEAAFWRRAVAGKGPAIDPLAGGFLSLGREDKVATAGSCFAQNIARYLKRSGFNYMVSETAHPIVPAAVAERHGYGLYSARYGNIYTARQLLQLFERAYGRFSPAEAIWRAPEGDSGLVDAFRPTIEPGGFASEAELLADRAHHFARVREMFETLDIFVFTLGLTEGWESRIDGAVYPVCPGVSGGTFDPERHAFHNFRVGEVTEDLSAFITALRGVNPKARIILTVSPVPLVATASGNHVLAATTYSKSALRAAAQEIAEDHEGVFYFPSYEIIMGAPAAARYFAENMRNVTEEGVAQVMSVFLRHAAGIDLPGPAASAAPEARDATIDAAKEWVQVMCDEALLDEGE
ncbi:GSCFA domain-containing protein [Rhizorhabdus dicambivorans]|uniref:GSCFA domain-containing protein n=1 Tax=Rhizorhabdus dicambivorans TaxID=1850238 RepID=A0A2A4FR88_9SPHN|nr:GSCFA domain-containing protein [Rhizorhabdus dicambivorans]ATE64029.1 GSCFA domain-containing protein [Rhizorhabdus dicambivorans]PCE40222.1 GSCFA domain-containing protein [Rhizorhabdus dicambivorans]